jgi:hypothetical protein
MLPVIFPKTGTKNYQNGTGLTYWLSHEARKPTWCRFNYESRT